jgi:uncharacterized protein DUF6804
MSNTALSRIVGAMLLFVAIIHLPIGFYTFLRIMVTGIAAYNAYEARNSEGKLWLILFIVAAIVFNPVIPIYLGGKGMWLPVDVVFGTVFLISCFVKSDGNFNKNKVKL